MKAICPECRQLVNLTSLFGQIRWETHTIVLSSGTTSANLDVTTNISTIEFCEAGYRAVKRIVCAECEMEVDVQTGNSGVPLNGFWKEGCVIPHFSGGKSEVCPGSYFDFRFADLRTMEALEK